MPMTTTYLCMCTWFADTEPLPTATTAGIRPVGWKSYPNNVLAYGMNRPAGPAYYHKPRGSWRVKQIWALYGRGNKIIPKSDSLDVYIIFEVTEPLLLSPFYIRLRLRKTRLLWYPVYDSCYGYGWGNANRAWRSIKPRRPVTKTVTVVEYTDSQLLLQFITPHASDMRDPRNVAPYYEIPVYKTTGFRDLPGGSQRGQALDDGPMSGIKNTVFTK